MSFYPFISSFVVETNQFLLYYQSKDGWRIMLWESGQWVLVWYGPTRRDDIHQQLIKDLNSLF